MRLVIVESPFAPQTPLPVGTCPFAMPCADMRKLYEHGLVSVNLCAFCRSVEDAKSVRIKESERNARYLDAALFDCLRRGEAPFASHGLYTRPGVLDDTKPEERMLGIKALCEWRFVADATVIYIDLGTSAGMRHGIAHAEGLKSNNHEIEYRQLGGDWGIK